MILEYLYSVLKTGDKSIFELPDKYFGKHRSIVSFIRLHHGKYNKYPEISTIEAKFRVELPSNNEPVSYWITELKERYHKTVLDTAVLKIAKNPSKGVELLQGAYKELIDEDDAVRVSNYSEDAAKSYERYEERKSTNGVTYLSTGDPELDKYTYGYRRGDLWIYAGYEKVGKSFELLRAANNVSKISYKKLPDKPIIFISCEVPAEEFYGRLDCMNAKIPYSDYEAGTLSEKNEKKLKQWSKKSRLLAKQRKLLIFDGVDFLNQVENYIVLYSPAILFIDSVHLLAKSLEWRDLYEVSINLKKMARRTGVPIIITMHANMKEGDSINKITSEVFSYFKAGRDVDFAFVLYKDEQMTLNNELGKVCVSARRGVKFVDIQEQNWTTMEVKRSVIEEYSVFMAGLSAGGDDDDGKGLYN
jgi:hypothetical protein